MQAFDLIHNKNWWLRVLLCLALLLPASNAPFASAATYVLPAVTYDPVANKIMIGSNTGAPIGSEAITIPDLAATLTAQGYSALVVDQGSGSWLLNASILISPTARLEATNASISALRLASPPINVVTITALQGGHLLIDGISVAAWDTTLNAVDTSTANKRSYLLAFEGGRMDILHSDVGYLGWTSGEGSGLAWRKRLDENNPATGATGRLEDSVIHHNLFGMYSYEAYGLTILRNQVHSNIGYGIDPHDDSQGFEVAYNHVYGNGNHGIIFSRLCKNNVIHHNEVHDNVAHGIMLDRGTNNNVIHDNLVYNQQDGIAIFQSSDNQIKDNILRNNYRGIRINATFDLGDPYDGVSTNNQITNNLIEDSLEHGIYLYARADRNLISGNTILRSGVNGVYIRSGGNRLDNNSIRNGVVGINISGGETTTNPPEALPALDPPGNNNVVVSTTVTLNSDVGIRILGGSGNRIGPALAGEQANRIESNGKDGLTMGDAVNGAIAANNQVLGNIIHTNTRHGVLINDATSVGNRISQNSITGNGQYGIKIAVGAQAGIQPPTLTTILADGQIGGMTQPNATVEVYSDPGVTVQAAMQTVTASLYDHVVQAAGADATLVTYASGDLEGKTYLGSATANGSGQWYFQLPVGQDPQKVTLLAIDGSGNTSIFGSAAGSAGPSAFYQLTTDDHGQTRIQVTGAGAIVTLADIQTGLGAANNNLLVNLGNGVWRLNASIFLATDVTLNLSPQTGVTELQLRSDTGTSGAIDYASFVYIRTHGGVINLDSVKVYSWNAATVTVDQDYSNGRAYLLAKYDGAMSILNSEVSYLGSADGESYGVSWRDINDSLNPTVLRTRVTGEVINSKFHHNYYGIYTFQASNMVFRGNEFYSNVRYGFDPHDFTHDVLVENNVAYSNGAHGFIISRGCNNFVFRNNKSYGNSDPTTSQAHGFMLDPGSPNSSDPQEPSFENTLENNEAYGNEGYGLRILGSNNNQVINNRFYQNLWGISVEGGSTGNTISGNQLTQNLLYGVYVRETANSNTLENNQINQNNSHGIYLRASGNVVRGNTLLQNKLNGITLAVQLGFANPQSNQVISNTITGNQDTGIDLRGAQQTLVQDNIIENSISHGIYLSDSASQNSFLHNTIRGNIGYGVRAHGPQTFSNTWSQNLLYANQGGGIALTLGANGNMVAPQLLSVVGNTVSGQATPGATVEIFADLGLQGQYFVGQAVAGDNGSFSLTAPGAWPAANLTAITIDGNGNASPFSTALSSAQPTETPTSSPTPTNTGTLTPSPTPTGTLTPPPPTTGPGTPTLTPTPTGTFTPPPTTGPGTPTLTPTGTLTPPETTVPGATPTSTLPPGVTATPGGVNTPDATATNALTPVATGTVTPSPSVTSTPISVVPGNQIYLPVVRK